MNEENKKSTCEKCGGRLAFVTGIFFYGPDNEPYEPEVIEKSIATEGEAWVGAYKCDKCGHLQGFFTE